jgi:hypothetical protein
MKEPLQTRYAPGYDLFKLIVSVILTIILIVLLLRERDGRLASLQTVVATLTDIVSQGLPVAPMTPIPTVIPEPTEAPPSNGTEDSQEAPADESADEDDANEAPAESMASEADDCPSNPTRIQVGLTVRVLDWLNFRAAPGLGKTILRTNKPGTQMEVIGGPVCTPQADNSPRAYLWWNVRMEDGREGWSAEAPLNFPNYFLEPVR